MESVNHKSVEAKVADIKEIMEDVAVRGVKIDDLNEEYGHLYVELAQDLDQLGIENPNPFADLWEFYGHWRRELPTYQDRREFVSKLYRGIWEKPTMVKSGGTSYVDSSRIDELRSIQSTDFDLLRLIRLCEELNIATASGSYLSTAMLVRAIVDHVPPIFGCWNFTEVANNYKGSKSFGSSMKHLDGSLRKIADGCLHTHIRNKETLPNAVQVDFSNDLDVLLSEVHRLLKP